MNIHRVASPADIAVSGLRAESARMNAIAANIANAGTTRTESGGPFRRQQVILSAGADGIVGVQTGRAVEDLSTDFPQVYDPSSPDADASGFVRMPNVDLPVEMINLSIASRAYQANAAVLKRHQEIVEVTLELLK